MSRSCITLLFLLAGLVPVAGQPPRMSDDPVAKAINDRDHRTAVNELLAAKQRDPGEFAKRDEDYLLAREAERVGDLATAIAAYNDVAARDAGLRPYALGHMARIARSTGNLMLERLLLMQLLAYVGPHDALAAPAAARLAKSYYESGNYRLAIGQLVSASPAQQPGTPPDRELQALHGEAHLKLEETVTARAIFTKLLDSTPDLSRPDEAAVLAVTSLDKIDGGSDDRAPQLTGDEHLRRASVLQADREFPRARLHYDAVASSDPAGPAGGDALVQSGKGLVQQGDLAGAVQVFQRVIDRYGQTTAARDALLQLASANARLGKHDEAVSLYQRFIDSYPTDEKVDRAYMNIVDVLRDKGDTDAALQLCSRVATEFAGKRLEPLALFSAARVYLARSDWPNALTQLNRLAALKDLGGANTPGATNREEVAFLTAYCLERQGNFSAAIDKYLGIPDGRDAYYGWRATERLRQLANSENAGEYVRQKVASAERDLAASDPESVRRAATVILRCSTDDAAQKRAKHALASSYARLPAYKLPEIPAPVSTSANGNAGARSLSYRLERLGIYDEAAAEFENGLAGNTAEAARQNFALAHLALRGDRAEKAVAFIEPLWRRVPADYAIEAIPDLHAAMLYPAPYAELVTGPANARGVDPRYLLAIMRQESRFDPLARSGAAARGLMQFISSTSERLATELGRPAPDADELYDPATSILFGSQYVADLFGQFPDKPEAAAAAYNAGEEAMQRWLARSATDEPAVYVAEIQYAQTKDYVYRVMCNYRMYMVL